jgi:RecA/RadA recombinase
MRWASMDRRRSKEVKEVINAVNNKEVDYTSSEKRLFSEKDLLPTGSTILNLAFSDCYEGGIAPGTMVNIVGDSSSGKSMLAYTIFAEASRHPKFKNYRFIYDESEASFFFDVERLFGLKEGRIETDIRSVTVQDFYRNALLSIKKGDSCIYCLDSFDGLSSEEEQGRAEDIEKGKDASGSYKMEKAKWSSEMFRNIVDYLERTESILIIISQTRDNIGVSFGEKKTRSGGNALRFYSTHEVWLSIVGHEKVKDREVGANVRFSVKKNKLTGKRRKGDFTIYYDYGIDDLGSCIEFLVSEGVWSGNNKKLITNNDMFPDAGFNTMISYIEDNNLEGELRRLVAKTWNDIEEEIRLHRKPRFGFEN